MPEPGDGACPLCRSSTVEHFAYARDAEYVTDSCRYEYLHCRGCEIVFLRDPPTDRLSEIYPPTYYSYSGDAVGSSRTVGDRIKEALDRRTFRKLLDATTGTELRVLDIGGGSGWLLTQARLASSRVTETHEVDLGESAREAAEASGHVFHAMPVEEFTSDLRFDLIIMLNLIEHVADPSAVLDALLPLLAPDGKLLIKTPNFDTVDCRLFKRSYWGGFHCPRHFVLFRRDSLARLALRRGYRVERLDYTQGAPQWTASVLAALAGRGRIEVTADRPMHTHPLYPLLNLAFAALDFARRPFAPTAQMICVLGRAETPAGEPTPPQ